MPWLIGLALIVRLAVPTGWMTATAADGGVALIPCTGFMPAPAATPHAPVRGGHHAQVSSSHAGHDGDRQQQSEHDGKAQQLCAFSGLALAGTPSAPSPLLARIAVDPVATRPAQLRVTGRGLAAPPPPATGPPFLA